MKRLAAIAGLTLPALALMTVAFILPLLWLARLSLDRSTGGGVLVEDVTAENYLQFFRDPFYLGILWRSLWMSAVVTAQVRPHYRALCDAWRRPAPELLELRETAESSHDAVLMSPKQLQGIGDFIARRASCFCARPIR